MLRDLRARSQSLIRDRRPETVEGPTPGESRNRRRCHRAAPALEALEHRRLLSGYTGPSRNLPVLAPSGAYMIQVSGPGAYGLDPVAS